LVKPAVDLDLTTCAAGFRGCNIDSKGDIYACGFLEELSSEFKLGNIKADEYSLLNLV
jgi:radical SAM protein with 4Fe4S-binding SPASM domain